MYARLAAAMLIAAASGAGPAAAATRSFPVGGFDRVSSSVPFDVLVHTGAAPSVRADGDQEAIDRLEIEVSGGELQIRTRPGSVFQGWTMHGRRLVIHVTVPGLTAAALSGPGNLTVDRARARRFTAALSGPGNLGIGMLEAAETALTLSGPGDISVAGHTASVRIVGSGPGNVRAGRLFAYDADVRLSGPGNVDAMATRTARIVLSGPGDVRVTGGARCAVTKSGPGDVRCG